MKTLAEKLKTSATLATDSLTTLNTSLRQLYPGQVHPAKLEEMKQSFCPCVTFLVAEVGCISNFPECVVNGKVCCYTGVVVSAHSSSRVCLLSCSLVPVLLRILSSK